MKETLPTILSNSSPLNLILFTILILLLQIQFLEEKSLQSSQLTLLPTPSLTEHVRNLVFSPGEWLSPERKYQETHQCSCAKPRLGELRSLKRETPSSKRTSLA
ncbi:hypothetical protein DEO72_LG9g2860 [Vigna unguiculata]|uniref:Uncharacterized protein n=1 Tax=Vigna unguiculata TaxID=3917 RepID=A0A4D6N209_VIGUN|nr:hypothetical protein DEO72_LG9g2860 [Vigna unguiculata]